MDESALLRTWQRTALAFAPVLVMVLFAGVLLNSIMQRSASTERVQDRYRRVVALHELETHMVNAETGQRGFIITGDSVYLGPYQGARSEAESLLAQLAVGSAPEQFPVLERQVRTRLDILQRALDARAGGFDRAREQLIAGRGLEAMAALRNTLRTIEEAELRQLDAELAVQQAASTRVLVTLGLGTLLVLVVGVLTNRLLLRHAAELERLNAQLQEQSLEVELQSHELQAQTMELEENGERLQALNEMLERRTREAEAANVAKATFLRTMSHELRTPLNAISGYADLLGLEVQGPLVPAQRGSVERIRLNAQHLIVLINDVLSFARLEAGKLELHAEHVGVQRIFEEAEQLVRSVLDGRGLEYHCIPAPEGLAVYADADRTRQILLNLLANAAKYSAGGCRVELSADATDEQVQIRVRDSGPGIPLELQESVFEPFVQGQQDNGSLRTGTGLGLSISRGLARSMGGDLLLESRPGEGATFTLVLPRAILVRV